MAAITGIVLQAFLLFVALFEPALEYKIAERPAPPIASDEFVRLMEAITDGKVHRNNRLEVLTNGDVYYPAELAAIRAAKQTINLEAYIFKKGRVTREFVDTLAERARAGVRVNLLLDAIGNLRTWHSYFANLEHAGGRVAWYHPLAWHRVMRMNNRTHRELIIIDGQVGFIGGSGFADMWRYSEPDYPQWRDTMMRVDGPVVSSLQSAFLENWLEAAGELLTGEPYFPFDHGTPGRSGALVVKSSPMAGASTQARVLYQTLLSAASKSVLITTPYFLPDRGVRAEMVRAAKERGVAIRVIAPGKHNDHLLTRRSSRRLYGDLLQAGVKIYEYQPAMIHAKTLVVDGVWSVVGSTNFDNRSFGLNDEANLVTFDPTVASRITSDFEQDARNSREITYDEWKRRPFYEKVPEWFGRFLERQQ